MKLEYDELLSNDAFNFKLRRYNTDGKRYMTWDSSVFPTPQRMIDDVASRGRKMVTIVDPHVKKDTNYPIYKEAEAKKYYVQKPDGSDFDGWCWPGSSTYLDVTSPKVREWWAGKFALDQYKAGGGTAHQGVSSLHLRYG